MAVLRTILVKIMDWDGFSQFVASMYNGSRLSSEHVYISSCGAILVVTNIFPLIV